MWIEKNRKIYRIRDWGPTGSKITLKNGFPTKKSAQVAMVQMQSDALRGEALVPRGGEGALAAFVTRWWPAYEVGLKPTAQQSEGSRLRNHVLPLLGHITLDDLDDLAVQHWVADLLAGRGGKLPCGRPRRKLAPKTIRNCHGLLHTILGAAVRQKLIRYNPCTDTTLPALVPHDMRFLTEPEAARLLKHVPAHWRALVLLLFSTGLRWGEACALRLMDVDVLTGRLTVRRSAAELGTGEIVYGTPKTARARRTVTYPTATVGAALAGLLVGKRRDDLVFLAPMGGAVRTRNFRRGWLKWVAAAGLDGLRIHDLRHTQAAWLISANVPLSAISRRLGHASIAVTDGIYGHLLPQVDEGIVAAIAAALEHIDPADLEAEIAAELADVPA